MIDVSHEKRFIVNAQSIPFLIGIVKGASQKDKTIQLATYANRKLFSSGLRKGDVVQLASFPETVMDDGTQGNATQTTLVPGFSCLVASSGTGASVSLTVPPDAWKFLSIQNVCIQIISVVEPWNLHFGKERSVPSFAVGWPAAVLWGRDGCVDKLPPYLAPNLHNLDHPDHILITFSESSAVTIEHVRNGSVKSVFCKLSLYPLFREERALPRDTSLLHSNLGSFTIAFWNPDMETPYHFNGADFSFSLAFISVSPDTR